MITRYNQSTTAEYLYAIQSKIWNVWIFNLASGILYSGSISTSSYLFGYCYWYYTLRDKSLLVIPLVASIGLMFVYKSNLLSAIIDTQLSGSVGTMSDLMRMDSSLWAKVR